MAAIGLVPGREGDPGAVGRPCGEGLRHLKIGEPAGRTIGQVHHKQSVQDGKGQFRSIRGWNSIADLTGDKFLRIFNRIFEQYFRTQFNFGIDFKGDFNRFGTRGDGKLPEPSAPGCYHCRVIGGKSHAGKHITRSAAFHIVALNREGQPAFIPAVQVADTEPGLGFMPRAVHQPFAVG